MALVGDIIQRCRRLIPDPCQLLMPPVLDTAVAATIAGAAIPNGTYYIVVTALTPWGETLISNELNVTLTGGQNAITVTITYAQATASVSMANVYIGTATGAENVAFPSMGAPGTVNVTQIQNAPVYSAVPPTVNTAFLPDTDGQFASAYTMFDWLNEALRELSRTAGGIRDYAGVPTQFGNPLYSLPQNWIAITDIWYDGYWMQGGERGNFFRRNAITASILTSATISILDNRTVIEVYPQPIRNGGTTTLTAPMLSTDLTATVANPGFALLPFGFMQVDSEIMSYSQLGTPIAGILRGLGGSVPVAHAATAPVTELNLVINGRRVFVTGYIPGQSTVTLPIPPGWSDILTEYVMYMARTAEQEYDKAENHLKRFGAKVAEWARTNSNPVKRRQIGPSSVPEAYYGGVPGGGGWLIPIMLFSLILGRFM